jgi:hypothetical protein
MRTPPKKTEPIHPIKIEDRGTSHTEAYSFVPRASDSTATTFIEIPLPYLRPIFPEQLLKIINENTARDETDEIGEHKRSLSR